MGSTSRLPGGPALVAIVMFTLITAACSSAAGAASPSGAGSNADAALGQALQFAACMRSNGIRDFPDPDSSGTLTIETVANGTSIDTDSPAFQRALTTCRDLHPPGFTGGMRSPEQQQAALKFAQCIRDHGVKDFPDPVNGEPLVNTYKIPSSNKPGGMAVLNAAMQKCGGILDEAAGGQR